MEVDTAIVRGVVGEGWLGCYVFSEPLRRRLLELIRREMIAVAKLRDEDSCVAPELGAKIGETVDADDIGRVVVVVAVEILRVKSVGRVAVLETGTES